MPRAVWTGFLSFGLVSIPVSLHPATSPKDVRFHLFDRQGRRVRYRRVSENDAEVAEEESHLSSAAPTSSPEHAVEGSHNDLGGPPSVGREPAPSGAAGGRELDYGDLVRGYEVEPGRFAMLEHGEIEHARPERSSTIELEDFVDLKDIDPVYFEKTYYVAPRFESAKPYTLLHRTLDRTHRVGIGRFVLRTKPHLVAIRAARDVLALETLYFGDEVRPASEVGASTSDMVTDRELRIAEQLVEMLATSWDPGRYSDDYRQELLDIIARKPLVDTPDAVDQGGSVPTPRVEELMQILKRSVEEAKAARAQGSGRRRRAG